AGALGGCDLDKTLKVTDVDVATPDAIGNKTGLPVAYAGGRADFAASIGGTPGNLATGNSGDNAVTMPGLLTDELRDIDTFPTRIEVDQRNVQVTNGTLNSWYRQMHKARASLERAIGAFKSFAPT